jgi:hypothetical protein
LQTTTAADFQPDGKPKAMTNQDDAKTGIVALTCALLSEFDVTQVPYWRRYLCGKDFAKTLDATKIYLVR